MIVNLINQYLTEQGKNLEASIAYEVGLLAQWSFTRQFLTDDEPVKEGRIRLSACGKCPRQLAYAYHGFEKAGKEIDSRAKLAFFAGDLVEIVVMQLAKVAFKKYGGGSITGTGRDQLAITLQVNGSLVEGHPDGLLATPQGIYLVECKSMSSFSFKRFEAGEIDDGYRAQINAYMAALGLTKCVLIACNKDSNVLGETLVERDDSIVKKLKENMLSVMKSSKDNLPEPPAELEADNKGFYSWVCLYCAYWKHCRIGAEKIVVGKSYKLKRGDL